jgi:hypothetical protein
MAMLALGATGFVAVFDNMAPRWGTAAVAGFLAGAATLAKLPAGPMIALPIGLALLFGLDRTNDEPPRSRKSLLKAAAIAAIVGVVTLSPYFVRNAVWTGNPVFPFLADRLGHAHWSEDEVRRWEAGHGGVGTFGFRLDELGRHWLFNAGYGSAFGSERQRGAGPDYRNVATFPQQGGVPVLWLAMTAGAVVGLTQASTRRLTIAMLLALAAQLAFWLAATHLQSRFLVPTLIPGGVLAGVAIARIRQPAAQAVAGATLVALLTFVLFSVFFTQSLQRAKPYALADSLAPERTGPRPPDEMLVGDHPINDLPENSRTLLVADVSRLFFLRRPIVYNHAFDPNPLGAIIRDTSGSPRGVTEALRRRGITHVWVHWSELNRLHTTYGFDRDVTEPLLRQIASEAQWRVVYDVAGAATLYALP